MISYEKKKIIIPIYPQILNLKKLMKCPIIYDYMKPHLHIDYLK